MNLVIFEQVADAARSLLPEALADFKYRAHRYGIKVWFGSEKPLKTHYEAQVIGAKHVPEADVLALEIGLHAEHRKVEDNDAVLAALAKTEKKWRKVLGDAAVAGPFIGRPDDWRRVSEVWPDPDLSEPDIVLEIAGTLADYITEFEKHLDE